VHISTNPPSLYWEEVALGYDAYSISKTGRDYHGNWFPVLAFPSFGDYKPALYFYAIVPFLVMFGQTPLAIRLPSALAGIITVYLVFLIGKHLKGEKFGLLAGFLFAIQPWSVHVSRVGFEANFALMLVTASVYMLLISKTKSYTIVISALLSVLALYTYHASRVVIPLLMVWLAYTRGHIRRTKWVFFSIGVACIGILPIVLHVKDPVITQRMAETSIFSGTNLIEKSNVLREADGNTFLARIVHHRYVVMGQTVVSQYLRAFSPQFLFLSGDGNMRHTNGMTGALYLWEFVSVLVGLYALFAQKQNTFLRSLVIPWMLISAIPVAVTTVSPHALRMLNAAPAYTLVSALGIWVLVQYVQEKYRGIAWGFTASICALFFVAFAHAEFVIYPKISAQEWQFGYEELITTLERLKKPSQHIFVTREQGRPSIYALWFTHQNPQEIQQQDGQLPKDQLELLAFGSYTFGDKIPNESNLLVASSPTYTPTSTKILHTISLPTGKVIWNIWESEK